MWEERLAIMKLVQEGKLSVEEAAALLEALEEEEAQLGADAVAAEGPGSAEAPAGAGGARGSGGTGAGASGEAVGAGEPWAEAVRDLEGTVRDYVQQFLGEGVDRERTRELRERVRSDLREALEQVREQTREVRERVREEVREALREARDSVREARESAREAAGEAVESAGDAVRTAGEVAGRGWGLGEILSGLFGMGLGPRRTVTREVEGRFEGAGPVEVDLGSVNGPITVRPADGPGYRLKATLTVPAADDADAERLADEVLEVETSGESLRVGLRREAAPFRHAGLRIECWLPRDRRYRLRARTVNGSAEVHDLEGESLEAKSVNGGVRLMGVRADEVKAKTANGSVRIHGQPRRVEAGTANGSIEIQAADAWGLTGEGRWELKTANGAIRVHVPPAGAAGVAWELKSLNGRLRIDLPGNQTQVEGPRMGRSRRASGRTEGFEDRPFRLTVEGRTTNGSVEVAAGGAAAASA